MKCEIYDDIQIFADEVLACVKAYETQNNLLLGNINRELQGGSPNHLKIAIKDEQDQVILVGAQVNPYYITLAEKDNKYYEGAIELLVKTLYKRQIGIPGCIAVEDLANRFSKAYTEYFDKKSEEKMGLNLLQAYKIQMLNKANGTIRLATTKDLPYWGREFSLECGLYPETIDDYYKNFSSRIEKGSIYIWEDESPVCVCMQGRSGDKGVAITFVYTPPYYRNKGYASECVAYGSQALLDKGFEHCYLFADQKNPISNKIYMNIGYEMMGITKQISFIDKK